MRVTVEYTSSVLKMGTGERYIKSNFLSGCLQNSKELCDGKKYTYK